MLLIQERLTSFTEMNNIIGRASHFTLTASSVVHPWERKYWQTHPLQGMVSFPGLRIQVQAFAHSGLSNLLFSQSTDLVGRRSGLQKNHLPFLFHFVHFTLVVHSDQWTTFFFFYISLFNLLRKNSSAIFSHSHKSPLKSYGIWLRPLCLKCSPNETEILRLAKNELIKEWKRELKGLGKFWFQSQVLYVKGVDDSPEWFVTVTPVSKGDILIIKRLITS